MKPRKRWCTGWRRPCKKRALPRSIMSDNGAAMSAAEFTQGVRGDWGFCIKPTLPYSPYQNAKMEFLWTPVLRVACCPCWKVKRNSDTGSAEPGDPGLGRKGISPQTPCRTERYAHCNAICKIPMWGRDSPGSTGIAQRPFGARAHAKQRRSDGTISLDGKRFEVPSRYRHLEYIHLHYAQWDPGGVDMVDERSQDPSVSPVFHWTNPPMPPDLRRVLATATEAVAHRLPTVSRPCSNS
jgi:putative transposase